MKCVSLFLLLGMVFVLAACSAKAPKPEIEVSPVKKEEAKKPEAVKVSSFKTKFSLGPKGRVNNIHVASQTIDGYILEAGKEFSFNGVVGKRTRANGYQTAPVISAGKMVPGIGGGVCQVSSTLHGAVRAAGIFKITERRPHSKVVGYCPRVDEAMVSYGTSDFRFVNVSEVDYTIKMSVTELNKRRGQLNVEIFEKN